jgi:hypothetical protein
MVYFFFVNLVKLSSISCVCSIIIVGINYAIINKFIKNLITYQFIIYLSVILSIRILSLSTRTV